MNSSLNESLQLARRVLIDTLSVQNYVEGRVYTSHFIDYDKKTTPMPLIILEYEGGRANYSMKSQRAIMRVYAYSSQSSSEAGAIYDAAYSNLNAKVLKHSSIDIAGYCYELTRPVSGFNEAVKGWFYRGTFILNTAG
tara:strand:+ start:3077 stop:3490 length:414 start_codon:yes stop_codon:yes gene_type:complete